MEKLCCTGLGVQKLDNAIHWIISIPAPDSANSFLDAAYPLRRDSDLHGG